jgi:hypothetical protein
MGRKRELFHDNLVREGNIRNWSVPAPCAGAKVKRATGKRFDLTFDLTDRQRIGCILFTHHAPSPRLGGCIPAISGEHRQQLTHYHEDHAAISLTAF